MQFLTTQQYIFISIYYKCMCIEIKIKCQYKCDTTSRLLVAKEIKHHPLYSRVYILKRSLDTIL